MALNQHREMGKAFYFYERYFSFLQGAEDKALKFKARSKTPHAQDSIYPRSHTVPWFSAPEEEGERTSTLGIKSKES